MFNLTFTDLKSALSLNKMTEAEIVHFLKSAMKNANYRKSYNHKKNEILKSPEVKEMLKKLSGK